MTLFFADLKAFLGEAAVELEKTFNNTCAFAEVNQVVMKHVGEMKETVERMRANARHLCAPSGEPTTPLRASLVVNSKHTFMSSNKFPTFLLVLISIPIVTFSVGLCMMRVW